MKVYVVEKSYDFGEDGNSILGVFSLESKAEVAVLKDQPKAIKDKDGDFEFKNPDSKFSEYTYWSITEYEVDEVTK